jgi:prepilin-type N-terminal cleavage/methylation domain-containing protein
MSLRIRAERTFRSKQGPPRLGGPTFGFTLIEMLVAMAITLVMMGAVVTLFANISNSVRNRRATTEMSGQLRHVRNVLQQDLQGATCPGVTWQKSESNHGYIEIIEGQYREGNATNLINADPSIPSTLTPSAIDPEIDHTTSTIPSGDPKLFKDSAWATDASALGDADDVLMLTVRNEHEPFNGRAPTNVRIDAKDAQPFSVSNPNTWGYESIESPLAEVVWFAVENPGYTDATTDPTANHFFGEPGFRTIYRRTLLIAPWLNPYRYVKPNTGEIVDTFRTSDGGTFKAQPGLLRMLPKTANLRSAVAAVIAFQDRYDLSVRLEWDADIQRWKIMANTLGDLTKRENRFGHFGVVYQDTGNDFRIYPFPFMSMGVGVSGATQPLGFTSDPDILGPSTQAKATAYLQTVGSLPGVAVAYLTDPISYTDVNRRYNVRPFTYVAGQPKGPTSATAQAMLNEQGYVVRVVHGPVPLWGDRRGQDVMMTDVLAFDLRVYDPNAPIFATVKVAGLPLSDAKQSLDVILTPSDPGWLDAYMSNDNMKSNGTGAIGTNNTSNNVTYPYVGQGAYVDLGYGYNARYVTPGLPAPVYSSAFASSSPSWFFAAQGLHDVYANSRTTQQDLSLLAPGFAVYDTWSFHYENNGINEDAQWFDGSVMKPASAFPPAGSQTWRATVDQGTDGLDNNGVLGVDDVNERETTPPYDKPLRGMQVLIRTYEHDSRSIRQVRVNQHFMAE